MKLLTLDTPEAFRDAWQRCQSANTSVPFRTTAWLDAWAKNYAFCDGESEGYAVAVATHDRIEAVVPLFISQSRRHGNTLRLFGAGEACTDYLTMACGASCPRPAMQLVARHLSQRDGEWDTILLDGLPREDAAAQALADALAALDHEVNVDPGMPCWRLDLPASWDDVLRRLSKTHRKQVRRLNNQVLSNSDSTVVRATNPNDVVRGMDILVDLHQRRWRVRGEPGCFSSAHFEQFLREAAMNMFQAGRLSLTWLEHAGEPIAVDLGFESQDGLFAYQGGISPDHLQLSPGRVMLMATVQHAITHGLKFIDFLRGDEPYKAHWRAEPVAMQEITILSRKLQSRARHRAVRFASSVLCGVRSMTATE